jgi:hypothetical protein
MRVMIIALKDFDPRKASIDPIIRDLRRHLPETEVHGDSGKIFLMSMGLSEISEEVMRERITAAGYGFEIESADGVQKTTHSPTMQADVSSSEKSELPWWKFWA